MLCDRQKSMKTNINIFTVLKFLQLKFYENKKFCFAKQNKNLEK